MRHNDHSEIVGKIYEAAFDGLPWSDALCAVADFCGAANAALVVTDRRAGYSNVVTPRADPDTVAAYADGWWQHDPTVHATASAPVGKLTTLADTGRDLFYSSEFHNDFWRQSGLGAERIATNLIVGEQMFASLVLQASNARDEIEGAHVDRFALFVPHFVRAVGLSRKLFRMEVEQVGAEHSEWDGCIGVVVVDAFGRLVFADAGAEAVVETGVGLHATGGVLRIDRAELNDRLYAAITAWASNGLMLDTAVHIELLRSSASSPLLLKVMPYRHRIAQKLAVSCGSPIPAAIVVIHDAEVEREARVAAIRQRYGLTHAEARLALEMAKGDGRAAAAKRCGISINTARTHLMRVFDKTGVARQAALVRLLRH